MLPIIITGLSVSIARVESAAGSITVGADSVALDVCGPPHCLLALVNPGAHVPVASHPIHLIPTG